MARNRLAKVLDLERALEARGEEAAKGRDERGEACENQGVELHGRDVEGVGAVPEEDGVGVRDEDGVGGAVEAG